MNLKIHKILDLQKIVGIREHSDLNSVTSLNSINVMKVTKPLHDHCNTVVDA